MFKMHNRSDYILQSKQYLSEYKNKEELNYILKFTLNTNGKTRKQIN